MTGTADKPAVAASIKVLPGIDMLEAESFSALLGLRMAVVSNQAARNIKGRRTIDALAEAPSVDLVAVFTGEHGLGADREGEIKSGRESVTGLPLYSLYGAERRPEAHMLAGLDALVIELQDVGARFYTYATTMAYVMEEAAKSNLKVFVLDRPNPIAPAGVRGPGLDSKRRSFMAYFPMPVQHGMTLGELAEMFNAENAIGADLTVIKMRGYKRSLWFDDTGLPWRNPSPNLRKFDQAILYPGVALIEGTNVSVGRGTDSPFELVGAPWIAAQQLAEYLQARKLEGVALSSVSFVPEDAKFAHQRCEGVRIKLFDRKALDAPLLGIELASALHKLFRPQFILRDMLGWVGSEAVMAQIEAGHDPRLIASRWRPGVAAFASIRSKYLKYPD